MNTESNQSNREEALAIVQANDENSLVKLAELIDTSPNDHLIRYLYAAELAQQQDYNNALMTFKKVLELETGFNIARFQLCLLALTLDDEATFTAYLPPLLALDESHYLSVFAKALQATHQQEAELAITYIEQGIPLNNENLPLNNDMLQLKQTIEQNSATTSEVTEPIVQNTETPNKGMTNSILLDIYKQKPGQNH